MAVDSTPALHPDRISPGYLTYSIISGVLSLVASIFVAIRFVHRSRIGDFWWDDWTILGALIFALSVLILDVLIALPSIGAAGYHINTYTIEQLELWAKFALAAEILYNPSVSLSRVSILLFYRRIFAIEGRLLTITRVIFFVLAAQLLISIFGLIFSYSPVQAQWEVTLPHTTINLKAFYVSTTLIKVVLDISMICIAQAKLQKLQLSRKRKLLLSVVFLVSALTVISSILRIFYLETFDLDDPTYTLTNAGIWTNVEMFLSIICACLPIVYSFFRVLFVRRRAQEEPSSTRRAYKPWSTLITFGSAPARLKRSSNIPDIELQLGTTGYQVICEPRGDGSTHSMAPLDPVRVETEFRISY